MNKLRLRYSKTGRAKYISHLDLMATMKRTLLRAGVRLKYSEGFNPHPYMSVALPLPVGAASVCELMDFGTEERLLPDGIPEILNAVLPEGLDILDAYISERKFGDIAWIDISGNLFYDHGAPPDIAESLAGRFSEENIAIMKKTKRGTSSIDIAPLVHDARFQFNGEVTMSARISAQNPSITPEDMMNALDGVYAALAPDFAMFTRTELFGADMSQFR